MNFLKVLLYVLVAFVTNPTDLSAEQPPNIIFIFADDWGWGDLSCHGHPYVKTPNIDRIAAEGTDFTRFTVASGVCSPSRTAVMTGHFPARYKIDGHFAFVSNNAKRGMPDWLSPDAPLLSRFLQQQGYATAHFGKWHLSNNMIPDSPLPSEYGYDAYGAFNCAGEQIPVHEDVDEAIDFIQQSLDKKKPFFINLWMHESHTPFHTVPKYRWRFQDLEEKDNIYASVLSHADDRVGKLLDAIERLSISEDTLVIFSSDNGPARAKEGQPLKLMHDSATGCGYGIGASKGTTGGRKGYKASVYEGGIGVPFLARWPGKIAAGEIDDTSQISAVDLLPTFCELAGVSLPNDYLGDGVSQVAALKGNPHTKRKKPLFWKTPSSSKSPFHWVAYAVVDQQWKLMTNKDQSQIELYDLVADPSEKENLAVNNPEVVKNLLNKIETWRKSLPKEADPACFSNLRNDM